MRIVLVNWARIWDGAASGGGVNGYCQALALELVDAGHDVVSLNSGLTYTPSGEGDEPGACTLVRHADWLGVRVFEVVNSPVLAPSIAQYADPAGEVSAPQLERVVGELFDELRADVVHFHNIEGFSVGCVGAARGAGSPVVFSLHNYHTICPQVYLMQGHRRACFDARGGHACDGCVEPVDSGEERRRRVRSYRAEHGVVAPPPKAEPHDGRVLRQIGRELTRLVSPKPESASGGASEPDLPGEVVAGGDDVSRAMPVDGPDTRGETAALLAERARRAFLDKSAPEWTPLSNDVTDEPECADEPNAYGRRRSAMVEMLNSCDSVLAVSEFVRKKFVSMGVREDLIRRMPIGTCAVRIARWHPELLFDPPAADGTRPIRVVYMGHDNYYKGLAMLADALELMTPELLRMIDLSVYAREGHLSEWRFRRLEPRLAGLTYVHGYRPADVPWMLGGKDVGIVPSVWWDNAPQTVFEFFACGVPVLGARLGGIPDFVRDGENGLLFGGNDRFDLARRLGELIRTPGLVERLRSGVRPPKSIEEHAVEMAETYAALGRPCSVPRAGSAATSAG